MMNACKHALLVFCQIWQECEVKSWITMDVSVPPDDLAGLNNRICEQVPVPTTLRSALMTWTRQNLMA